MKTKAPKVRNPVARHAHKFNRCKCIEVNEKLYNRKVKHKNNNQDYSGVAVA